MFGKMIEAAGRLFKPKNQQTGWANPSEWFMELFGGVKDSDAGIKVTWQSALSYPPVWYAVNKLCGHLAQMPIHKMRRLERGAEVAFRERADFLLNVEPNAYQTPAVFKEQLMMQSLIKGNGRAVMIRIGATVQELLPIDPDRTKTEMVNGEKWHVTHCDPDDRLCQFKNLDYLYFDGNRCKIHDRDVFHVPGISHDGVAGLSMLHLAKNSWGLGLAAEKAASKDFGNGAKPGGVVKTPRGMFRNDEDAQAFITAFNKFHQGVDNTGKWALAKDDVEVMPFASSSKDKQWVEQRTFQRQEVALWFLLETILGDDNSVSYNSLEQKNLAYLVNSLMRWIIKWEQEANKKLCSNRQKTARSHYFKFNVASLLRADSKTTMETLSSGIAATIYSPNEAREMLDMNPYEGGDEFQNPAITPGTTASEQEETDPADSIETDQAEDSDDRAFRGRLEHLIGVETNRVIDAAGKPQNFVTWLDHFYDGWTQRMGIALTQLGGDEAIAERHCRRSHEMLLDLSGKVNDMDALKDAVTKMVESWPQRAGELIEEIRDLEMVG